MVAHLNIVSTRFVITSLSVSFACAASPVQSANFAKNALGYVLRAFLRFNIFFNCSQ
jgi:hypothetical protein